MAPGTVDALLFDVGGVVIRIDFNRAFARWATLAACDPALLRQRFLQDPPYQRHERVEDIKTMVLIARSTPEKT